MQPFRNIKSKVVPLDRVNVDTDAIIPKQFLKKIERTGFGVHLFHDWRYLDDSGSQINTSFALNDPDLCDAKILISRENFGCGSSREHAPWALADWGFRCIIAISFADIFYNNCIKNGILPVVLKSDQVAAIFGRLRHKKNSLVEVILVEQKVKLDDGQEFEFAIDEFKKHSLIHGLDDIGWTLQYTQKIDDYEKKNRQQFSWLWA